MAIQLICPNLNCRKRLTVPDDVRGKMLKCQYCQTEMEAPQSLAGESEDRSGRAHV